MTMNSQVHNVYTTSAPSFGLDGFGSFDGKDVVTTSIAWTGDVIGGAPPGGPVPHPVDSVEEGSPIDPSSIPSRGHTTNATPASSQPSGQTTTTTAETHQVQYAGYEFNQYMNWSSKDWEAAFKRNPEKFLTIFTQMSLDGTLSADAQDHAKQLQLKGAQALQAENRFFTGMKSLLDAQHETLKSLISFRV